MTNLKASNPQIFLENKGIPFPFNITFKSVLWGTPNKSYNFGNLLVLFWAQFDPGIGLRNM